VGRAWTSTLGAAFLVCGGCGESRLIANTRGDGGADSVGIQRGGADSAGIDDGGIEDAVGDAVGIEDAVGDASGGEGGPSAGPPPWLWGDSSVSENQTVAFVGYDQGCSDYGPLDELGGELSFRAGFSLVEPPVDRLKHYDVAANAYVDDGALAGYAVVGAVLLMHAAKTVQDPTFGDLYITELGLERFADPGAVSPSGVSIQGTWRVDGLGGCGVGEQRCTNSVDPTIVLVWQDSLAGTRAYQFMRPKPHPPSDQAPSFAQCAVTMNGFLYAYTEGLGVYWPLREDFARELDGAPDPTRWTEWIDEVLPR
jgi:hypothetical protein